MNWSKISLSVEQQASGEVLKIMEEVETIFTALGAPKGFMLWASSTPTAVYFSPVATNSCAPIIKAYNGAQCDQPTSAGLAFLLGHESDRETLP